MKNRLKSAFSTYYDGCSSDQILNSGMDNFLKINEDFKLKHSLKTKQYE
jgi:hypothetical protein